MKQFNSYKDVRIGVYAICADEPNDFIDHWLESMSGADKIYVLVTKANNPNYDYLEQKLKDEKFATKLVVSEQEIKPWRFDVARNESLKFVNPEEVDALICTDIDEILIPEFWDDYRKAVFEHPNFDRVLYRYAWNHDEEGKPDRVFWYDKTHQPTAYHWEYPVHETLTRNIDATSEGEYRLDENKIYLHHYPDQSKSRSSYLGLLELRAKEYPNDLYGLFYLGREYRFNSDWENCIATFVKLYLRLCHTPLDDMGMKPGVCDELGRACYQYDAPEVAVFWYSIGIQADPTIRDNYIHLAQLYAWTNHPSQAREIIIEMQANTKFVEDWRLLPYMWSIWKTEQILADCCMWEQDYKAAAQHMAKALEDITTDIDRQYASEEGFYQDLEFLAKNLSKPLTSNN